MEKKQSVFLQKLKEALDTGESNEATNYINEIDKCSKSINSEEANERLLNRVEKSGYAKSISKEDLEAVKLNFDNEMQKYKSEEEKYALITEIVTIEGEWFELDQKLCELRQTFKEKYGEEEFKKTFISSSNVGE